MGKHRFGGNRTSAKFFDTTHLSARIKLIFQNYSGVAIKIIIRSLKRDEEPPLNPKEG